GPYESVPEKFAGRKFYKHNPTVTLMRTTEEENKQIGQVIAQKLNMTKGQTTLMLPLKGLSGLDVEGQAFYGPEEDQVLFDTLKQEIVSERVTVEEVDTDVNDPIFAERAAERLIQMIESNKEHSC